MMLIGDELALALGDGWASELALEGGGDRILGTLPRIRRLDITGFESFGSMMARTETRN